VVRAFCRRAIPCKAIDATRAKYAEKYPCAARYRHPGPANYISFCLLYRLENLSVIYETGSVWSNPALAYSRRPAVGIRNLMAPAIEALVLALLAQL
jgi:hypothetical protein